MKIIGNESEQALLKELGMRLKQYRISRNITQLDLANQCGISISTVVRIENGIDSKLSSYLKFLNALDLLQNLDLLIPEQQPDFKSLFEQKPARQRAKSNHTKSKSDWVWGEDQ